MDFRVNILAHNEEELISTCISSVLRQTLDNDDRLFITVISNGCSDRTEDIVRQLAEQDSRVSLFPIVEGGKVNALRTYVESGILNLKDNDENAILFFMDADVQINDSRALTRLAAHLIMDKDLYAVSAFCIPESVNNNNSDYVSRLYRVQFQINSLFKPNIFRGMFYCIRSEILKRLHFPTRILSDDICMEISLEGHFITDYTTSITYTLHKGIKREVRRNLMHCLAVLQAYSMLNEGKFSLIDQETQKTCYKGKYFDKYEIVMYLIKKMDLYSLSLLVFHNIYHKYNCRKAKRLLLEFGTDGTDYQVFWRTRH